MRIDLSNIDRQQFSVKEGMFCGLPAVLVTPALQGTQWTQANKHLRSSVWSLEGELLSAGLPKFTNAFENPEHFPMPKSLDNALCVEKVDGSLAVFDYVNNQFSCRSRGTFSCSTLENAGDWEHCMAKYPFIQSWCAYHPDCSLLCEITSPNQRIILDYGDEPDLTLIGVVDKTDYSLWSQKRLDVLGEMDIKVKRPRYFTFSSLDACLTDVAKWEGLEGCVIYSGADQVLHKIKTNSYLRLHRFKERVTLPNLTDLFFQYGKPTEIDFIARIEQDFDYECAKLAKELAIQITNAHLNAKIIIVLIEMLVNPLKELDRRDAALKIQELYEGLERSVAFNLLSGKGVDDKMLRKLMEWELES